MKALANAVTRPVAASSARSAHGEYCPPFDYLRMTLAIGVFAVHADAGGVLPESLGLFCVQVFFALSGYLIGGILLRSRPADLPRFYFNRSTRIWVPYYVAIALLVGMTIVRQPVRDPLLWEFVATKATFVYNWFGVQHLATMRAHMPLQGTGNHFWSICVEEQFYLLAPFLLVFVRRAALPLFALLIALNLVVAHSYAGVAAGVLLAYSCERLGPWHRGRAARIVLAAIAVVGTVAALALSSRPSHWVQPFVATAIVALAATPGRQSAVGAFVGGVSYPFYLNHWVGLVARRSIERHVHMGIILDSCAALAVALAFSSAHYWFIDRRIQRGRSAYFTPKRGLMCCAAGFTLVLAGVAFGLLAGL